MPFVSKAQRKGMFENEPEMAKEGANIFKTPSSHFRRMMSKLYRFDKTPKGKKLPEHIKKQGRKNNKKTIGKYIPIPWEMWLIAIFFLLLSSIGYSSVDN